MAEHTRGRTWNGEGDIATPATDLRLVELGAPFASSVSSDAYDHVLSALAGPYLRWRLGSFEEERSSTQQP